MQFFEYLITPLFILLGSYLAISTTRSYLTTYNTMKIKGKPLKDFIFMHLGYSTLFGVSIMLVIFETVRLAN